MTTKNITETLKSQNAVVAVLVLALLAQMPHAKYVFLDDSHDHSWFGWLQAWGGAIALEVAVLVFVIRGNVRVSWGFALFSVAVNLIYYSEPHIAWYVPRASWLLSAGLPVAIALYSHEVAHVPDESSSDELQTEINRLQIELESVSTKLQRKSGQLEQLQTEYRSLATQVDNSAIKDELTESVVAKLDELIRIVSEQRITQPADLVEHGINKADAYKIWPVAIAGRYIYKNGDGAYHVRS